ncbi:reverse transcriptase domain-containing protein [Tanacetum coccineum]
MERCIYTYKGRMGLGLIDLSMSLGLTTYVVHDKISTKEIFTPFENPKREFRSSRKLCKTPSLDESSSPKVDLFSHLEEHSKEEVPGTMTETMDEYMTRSIKTSNGLAAIQAQLNNLEREIKKVNEKVYAAQVGCELYITVKHSKGFAENVLVGIGKFVFPVDFIILDMPEDINVPLILERSFLSTFHAKVDVFNRKISLRVRYENIIFNSVKPASSIIKKVYMLGLRERMDLDLEDRIIGETLILNRSFDPLYGDYIELNNLNEPIELRRNRNDDLEPTIKEGEVVNEPMVDLVKTRCDFIDGLNDYPILENMDIYRDKDMGDVIIGEPFCKVSCVEARRFDGLITIHNGDDNMTYQMVSAQDELNGISHSYQKLKTFYKGILDLGPVYNRDEKIVEKLPRGHISMHEIE